MNILDNFKARLKAALVWTGDEMHRRALAGVIAGGLGYFLHEEIDSTTVDLALIVILPAVLSMWTPKAVAND